jgi:large subunit ribosomal protein L10
MSKVIKQMQMDAIRKTFDGVRDMVVLSIKGLDCQGDYALRATLRKKNVRMMVLKNSLARRVFGEIGLQIPPDSKYWEGPSTYVWGAPGTSIAEVSRAVEVELKNPKTAARYKDKVVVKGAVAEGEPLTFEAATKRPTREEAIAAILGAILSPGSSIAGCLTGPAAQVASQIKTISEKGPAEGAAAPAEAAPATAG